MKLAELLEINRALNLNTFYLNIGCAGYNIRFEGPINILWTVYLVDLKMVIKKTPEIVLINYIEILYYPL